MLLCANAALEENKQKINELNVFPVPDGDTGTNMSLTMNSAAIELGRKQTDTVGAVADCAASALLRGARGNSGVILSLLFRGIAKSLKGRETASAAEFAAAVSAGVVGDVPMLDLCYEEDSSAQVDLNCVMDDQGRLIEIQGTGEGRPFTLDEQRKLVELCAGGIRELQAIQKEILGL